MTLFDILILLIIISLIALSIVLFILRKRTIERFLSLEEKADKEFLEVKKRIEIIGNALPRNPGEGSLGYRVVIKD